MATKRANKAPRPRPRYPRVSVSLVALHREFRKIRARLRTALRATPDSANFRQLREDLTAAEHIMGCARTGMFIFSR